MNKIYGQSFNNSIRCILWFGHLLVPWQMWNVPKTVVITTIFIFDSTAIQSPFDSHSTALRPFDDLPVVACCTAA